MKKIVYYLPRIILITLSIVLVGCTPMTMNNVYKEPNFSGQVEEVYEKSILVKVAEDENLGSDLISVSLDVKLRDSRIDFQVGDEVNVYYDGNMAESYPSQVHTVYAITLIDKDEPKQGDL